MPTAVPDTMSPGHSSVEGKQACPGRCTVYPNCDCYKARLPQKCSTCNYRSFLVLGVRAHLRRMVRTQGMVAGLQIDLQTCHHANLPIDLQQVHRPWSENILQIHSPMMMDVMLHGTPQHERCFNTCNTNIDELLNKYRKNQDKYTILKKRIGPRALFYMHGCSTPSCRTC